MSEQEKQESQKTVVAFIAGLLIGGLLVWVFSGAPETTDEPDTTPDTETSETTEVTTSTGETNSTASTGEVAGATSEPELPVGNASVSVNNQAAGTAVSLEGATFPSDEGWIGVREYNNDQLGYLLGVVRYSKEQGLIPESIVLQRPTTAGRSYAIVFYSENGDRVFNLANDVQVGGAIETFTAQ